MSVIIPTYNRSSSLRRTLGSVGRQTFPADRFEVVVVDDGSTDETEQVGRQRYPFLLRYVYQANQGDAIARNRGAEEGRGELLIFLDDDILVVPQFIASLVAEHERRERVVVIGSLRGGLDGVEAPLKEMCVATRDDEGHSSREIDFWRCLSGLLSVRRSEFLLLGMMQPVTSEGSSVWCDVEFAYRAYLSGFSFRRCCAAIGYHDDGSCCDLRTGCRRSYRAAAAAVVLFERHPGLLAHLTMFQDKTPVDWRADGPRLVARKLARHAASSRMGLGVLELVARVLTRRYGGSRWLRRVHRWVMGGYVFRGYRDGLRRARSGAASRGISDKRRTGSGSRA